MAPSAARRISTLGLIRNAGIEPQPDDLKNPRMRLLRQPHARAGLSVRDIVREKGTPYAALHLFDRSRRRMPQPER